MRIWIDTEFNSFKGAMISIALVAEDGSEFYEAVECKNPHPWVKQNVMPNLNTVPIPMDSLRLRLQHFLKKFDTVHIIADWPEDIANFCQALVTFDGMCVTIPPLTMEIRSDIKGIPEIPHNALSDARANMLEHLEIEVNGGKVNSVDTWLQKVARNLNDES
jgi:hypothetical protein